MAYVLKVRYEETLRRITVHEAYKDGPLSLSFDQLEHKIKELFGIPLGAKLNITYADMENDVVTMANDQDLMDALLFQRLNPLRVHISINDESRNSHGTEGSLHRTEDMPEDLLLKQFLNLALNALGPAICAGKKPSVNVQKQIARILELLRKNANSQPVGCTLQSLRRDSGFGNQKQEAIASSTQEAIASGTLDVQPSFQPTPAEPSQSSKPTQHVFHCGIQCDGCGQSPIVGTRFKSLRKPNYDLCMNCFANMGTEGDYVRYDRPRKFHKCHPTGSCNGKRMVKFPSQVHSENRAQVKMRSGKSLNGSYTPRKLDCRFLKDVTVVDGTELSSGTRFSKSWRLLNNGTMPWPHGTQLVHIGGDELAALSAVLLELPEGGLPVDAEIEACVDLIAPEKPGRYVSYWRLKAPTGQRFGYPLWANIHVVEKQDPSDNVIAHSSSKQRDGVVLDPEKHRSLENATGRKALQSKATVPEPMHSFSSFKTLRGTFKPGTDSYLDSRPEKDALSSSNDQADNFETVTLESSGPFSTVHLSGIASQLSNVHLARQNLQADDDFSSPKEIEGYGAKGGLEASIVENSLIALLDSMGFVHRTLNVELLRKNQHNFQRTLDDLCLAAEWDPLLRELDQMGFCDWDLNRQLLFKNKGSLKRVVKELVQLSNESAPG